MKNWEFDKEVPSIFQIRRAAVFIDTERGVDEKAVLKPMRSKTNSSFLFGYKMDLHNIAEMCVLKFAHVRNKNRRVGLMHYAVCASGKSNKPIVIAPP